MTSPASSPDPRRGLFETLLVVGEPVELDAHLRRLGASAERLYGVELPTSVREEAIATAAGVELGRMRIEVRPSGDGRGVDHVTSVTAVDPSIVFPDHLHGASLRSVEATGWSGAHKWADRGWLEEIEVQLGETVPLLVDADGSVLEAGRANVFAVVDGTLITPPADGRVLPGTGRAATLRLAGELGLAAQERALSLGELRGSGEAFLTSSVRGIRPVRSLDGDELPGGPTTERLASELRRRWLGDR